MNKRTEEQKIDLENEFYIDEYTKSSLDHGRKKNAISRKTQIQK